MIEVMSWALGCLSRDVLKTSDTFVCRDRNGGGLIFVDVCCMRFCEDVFGFNDRSGIGITFP